MSAATRKKPVPTGEEPSFEGMLERLEAIVEQLEGGELTLEDSLRLFEEGMGLAKVGAERLDAAERKVELLLQAADGTEQRVPFEPEADEEEG